MPTTPARRRLSSSSVALGAGIALALSLAACSEEGEESPEYAKVCVDQDTLLRADDSNCPDDSEGHVGYVPYYYPMSMPVPAVGKTVQGTTGTYSRPAGASYFGKVPASGGFGAHTGTSGT